MIDPKKMELSRNIYIFLLLILLIRVEVLSQFINWVDEYDVKKNKIKNVIIVKLRSSGDTCLIHRNEYNVKGQLVKEEYNLDDESLQESRILIEYLYNAEGKIKKETKTYLIDNTLSSTEFIYKNDLIIYEKDDEGFYKKIEYDEKGRVIFEGYYSNTDTLINAVVLSYNKNSVNKKNISGEFVGLYETEKYSNEGQVVEKIGYNEDSVKIYSTKYFYRNNLLMEEIYEEKGSLIYKKIYAYSSTKKITSEINYSENEIISRYFFYNINNKLTREVYYSNRNRFSYKREINYNRLGDMEIEVGYNKGKKTWIKLYKYSYY